MPTGFEEYEGFSKKSRKWILWLIIEMYARHPVTHPITAKDIGRITTRYKRDDLGRKVYKHGIATMLKGLVGTEVRAIMHFLRKNNYPIASGSKGYWIAKNEEELVSTKQHLRERRKAIDTDIKGLEDADFNIEPTMKPGEQGDMFNNYGVTPGHNKRGYYEN